MSKNDKEQLKTAIKFFVPCVLCNKLFISENNFKKKYCNDCIKLKRKNQQIVYHNKIKNKGLLTYRSINLW